MSSSTEQTLDYLVSEICKKVQSVLHHQHGSTHHPAQISAPIVDLVLRSKLLQSNIATIKNDTKSILISPKQSIQIINDTADILLNDHDVDTQTLKMQFTLSAMTKDLDSETTEKIAFHRNMFNQQIEEIIKIIPYNASTMTKLYDHLFELLCANDRYIEEYNENKALDRITQREINDALENIFPRSQIKQYKSLSNEDKINQIHRLIDIVYGVRLFDRDVGKGGSSITDIPKLVEIDLSQIYGDINNQINTIQTEIENYTKIIVLEYYKPGTITTPLLSLQCELRNRYQFIEYLKHYKEEIVQSTEILHTIINKYNDELNTLHILFKTKDNPLKTLVYPKFAQLSYFWKLVIAEKYCNESRKEILETLRKFQVSFKNSLNEKDIELTILNQHQNNENQKFIPFHAIQAMNSNIVQIDHNILDTNDIKYRGFCLMSLTNKNGMLFGGDNKQTLIQFNDNKYCFYTFNDLKEFATSPKKYQDALNEILIKYPELLNILGLNDEILNAPSPITALQLNSMIPHELPKSNIPRKVSQGVGTPTHFIEENIVPEYSWNEWDLRRRALQIVNMRLKNMKTHSTQTDLSHYRRDNATQYYLKQPLPDGTMTGISTQTGIERATNVPKKKKFITGLRGNPNQKMSLVTLTFDPPIRRMN